MGERTVKVFLDLEMNPIPKVYKEERILCRNEVIQVGAVALDVNDELIGEYTRIVRPKYSDSVRPEIFRLTGITKEMLNEGIVFEEVINEFEQWCLKMAGDEPFEIYAWSNSDLIQLQQEMLIKDLTYFFDRVFMNVWVDFQYEFSELVGIDAAMSLDKAVNALDIRFVGNEHNALSDAFNTAKLYQMTRDKENFEKLMKPVKEMMQPSKQLSTSMGSVFNMSMFNFEEEQ